MTNKLTYFISRFSIFCIGTYMLFHTSGKDSWISVILGTILGIIVLYIYSLIKKYYQTKTLRETLNQTTIGKFFLGIFIIFYLYIIIIILTILPTFVNSFYLINTPKIFINGTFLLLAIYLAFKDRSVLENLSSFLFILSLFIIIIFTLFLTKYIDINNIKPILTTKPMNIIKSSLFYASLTSIPQILTINYNSDFKHNVKDYIIASISLLGIIFFDIVCLGEPLLEIYSFPEYEVLKQIKVLKFIENIENISSFVWYFDLFIALGTITTNLKIILPKKYNSISFISLSLIPLLIATLYIGSNYIFARNIMYTFPYILFIFLFLFILLLVYLKTKNKSTKKFSK